MGNCMSYKQPRSTMTAESKHRRNYPISETPEQRIMYKNGCTRSACGFSKRGHKGINQDTMLVWEGFGGHDDVVFCGIFDGHGSNGHLVAKKVREHLPFLMLRACAEIDHELDNGDESSDLDLDVIEFNYSGKTSKITLNPYSIQCVFWKESTNVDNKPLHGSNSDSIFTNVNDNTSSFDDPDEACMRSIWTKKMVMTFHLMDENLKLDRKIDSINSGTTAIAMILQGKELVIGHVGDSRAILVKRTPQGSLVSEQLTIDLKPNLPGELERIKRYKGQVFALPDEPHLARLWSPYGDTPGLAMARSLGDFCLKSYGLSATPELTYRTLTEDDEFIVLATDGVWEVLSNEDVVRIVVETWPKEDAAKAVVDRARRAWRRKYGSWRMDDCTAICLTLEHKSCI